MRQEQFNFTQGCWLVGIYCAATTEASKYEIFSPSSYEDPVLNLSVDGHNYPCLIDTGATFSTLNIKPKQAKIIGDERTVGIEGSVRTVPRLDNLKVQVGPLTTSHTFIVVQDTPVNLLGRDLLCKLNAKLHCIPDGIKLKLPIPNLPKLITAVMV